MSGIGQSGIYANNLIGALRPKVMCLQITPRAQLGFQLWNLVLPSGHSDIEQIAGSCPAIPIEPSGYLNFGSGLNVITTPWNSRTTAFIFIPKWYNKNQVSTNISIFNMKLWINEDSAFDDMKASGLYPYIQILPSGKWVKNLDLPSGAYGAYEAPISLPSSPNIMRIDGVPWLSGVGFERTQIIYSSIVLPPGTYKTGRYGGLNIGTFRWRFTYDWTAKNAHINIGIGSGSYTDY